MKNRQRGRNNGKPRPPGGGGGGGGRNPNFDGGNNGRMRGNAQQLMEKYLAMARDATSAGDRVLAENYFQHADHYYRVLNARFEQQGQSGGQQQQRPNDNRGQQNYDRQGDYNQGSYEGDQQRFGNNDQNQQDAPQQNHQPQAQPQHQPQAQPQPQPQPQPYVQPYVQQPVPQPVQSVPEPAEIGLPPGILGEPAPPMSGDSPSGEEGGDFGDRPRPQQGARRRRGRGERPFADAEAGE